MEKHLHSLPRLIERASHALLLCCSRLSAVPSRSPAFDFSPSFSIVAFAHPRHLSHDCQRGEPRPSSKRLTRHSASMADDGPGTSSSASSISVASARSASPPSSSASSSSKRPGRQQQSLFRSSSPIRQREGSWTASDSSAGGEDGDDNGSEYQRNPHARLARRQDSWSASSSSDDQSQRADSSAGSSDEQDGASTLKRKMVPSRLQADRRSVASVASDAGQSVHTASATLALEHGMPLSLIHAINSSSSSSSTTGIAFARPYFEGALRASLQTKRQQEAKNRARVMRKVERRRFQEKRGREKKQAEAEKAKKKKSGRMHDAAAAAEGAEDALERLDEEEDSKETRELLDALAAQMLAKSTVEEEAEAWLQLIEREQAAQSSQGGAKKMKLSTSQRSR